MSRSFRTYEQAIEFIFRRINYERIAGGAYAADLKLDRMRQLLALLGNPQDRIPAVHIAGTKGKGSTAVMAAEILAAAGHRTGLFTSPHLTAFEERMVVDGASPSPAHLTDLANRLVGAVDEIDRRSNGCGPTYFELATALAWLYFLDRGAEIAVLEVGLGGRLDATNVCRPLVCVITNISRDHTNILGSTLAQIAREKAGIVKTGVPVLSGVADGPAGDVIDEVCRTAGSPLFRLGTHIHYAPAEGAEGAIDVQTPWGRVHDAPVPLRGTHQRANAALAIAAAAALRDQGFPSATKAVLAGLSAVRWPARIEVVGERPTVIVDAAHNWASAEALVRTIEEQFPSHRRILVFAATRDKDVSGMLRLFLPRFDSVILTQYQTNPRCVTVDELAALVQATAMRPCHAAGDAAAAWRLAQHLSAPEDLICVTGSFFIAAELREVILELAPSATTGATRR